MAQDAKCNECGCSCRGKSDQGTLHLHVEIENLKQKLVERENHIMRMETNFLTEVDKYPNGECAALAEELLMWQEKYSRLYEAHKRVQKVNQNLEDKLLKIVDKCETEKSVLTKDIAQLEQKLTEAHSNMMWLKEENERNRNDVNLAIQLLQCKPSNFVPQKLESLPVDLQQKVKLYMSSKKKNGEGNGQTKHEMKTIKVPIPTFPPTAMFYSINKSAEKENENQKSGKQIDIVSAAIMAKILEEREKERQNVKHCATCVCPLQRVYTEQSTQTENCLIPITSENGQIFIDNHGLFGNSKSHILKVETYQSQSPSVTSAVLIERTCVPVSISNNNNNDNSNNINSNNNSNNNNNNNNNNNHNNNNNYNNNHNHNHNHNNNNNNNNSNNNNDNSNNNNNSNDNNNFNASQTPKRNEMLKLNVGRNRYHSSKLSRGVNRGLCSSKKEKSDEVVRNSEIYMDGSVRFSEGNMLGLINKEVAIDIESEGDKNSKTGPRRCSLSVQMGSSNILLDNVTCFTPVVQQHAHPYALVHSCRSRSVSDSGSSNDESSESRPTETRL